MLDDFLKTQSPDELARREGALELANPVRDPSETPEDRLFIDLHAALDVEFGEAQSLDEAADRAQVANDLIERDGAKILAAIASTTEFPLLRWAHIGGLVGEAKRIFEAARESAGATHQ